MVSINEGAHLGAALSDLRTGLASLDAKLMGLAARIEAEGATIAEIGRLTWRVIGVVVILGALMLAALAGMRS